MSFARDLREQFVKPSAPNPKIDETISVPQDGASSAIALGINSIGMVEVIITDISDMIKSGQRYSLDGYILCLSRIISHNTAWECITRAYKIMGETVPKKYQQLFDKEITDSSLQKTMSVS